MIPDDVRAMLLRALDNFSGDSLERAERAFRGMTPEQLAMPHGCSGCTRQELLDDYRVARAQVDRAKMWVLRGGQ